MFEIEIETDNTTVWVNSKNGMCIGRFGPRGVDVHHQAETQITKGLSCLDCTHTKPTLKDWHRFQNAMLVHHHILIPDDLKPTWLLTEVLH